MKLQAQGRTTYEAPCATGSRAKPAIWLFALVLLVPLVLVGSAAAATTVPLATAESFAVLAGAGITNTGPTTVSGDIGTFPTTTISGARLDDVNGTNHAGDAVTQQAKNDLVTAYNNAAGQVADHDPIAADLAGLTLTPGVYNSASSIGPQRRADTERRRRPERGLRLPGRLGAHDRVGQPDQPDQRRPVLQRVLAGRQLGDARHGLDASSGRSSP